MLAPGLQAADGLAAAADEVHRLVLVSSSIDCVSCSMSVRVCELQHECVRVRELQHECVRVRE